MSPQLIIVGSILRQNPAQVRFTQNDYMVDALAPDRSDQPFSEAVLKGSQLHLTRYYGGLHDHLDSLDLTRIFSADHASASGMARSENQTFHRQRFREAVAAIGKIGSHVLDSAVCREVSLELILLREETGRPFAAPPAVPADRLAGRPRLFCSRIPTAWLGM